MALQHEGQEDADRYFQCIGCGRPAECEGWGGPICYPCHADWWRGSEETEQQAIKARHQLLDQYTARWLAAKKKARAA